MINSSRGKPSMALERSISRAPNILPSLRDFYHFSIGGNKAFITLEAFRKPHLYLKKQDLKTFLYLLAGKPFINSRYVGNNTDWSLALLVNSEIFFKKTGFTSAYFSCSGKVLASIVLLKFAWKKKSQISRQIDLFLASFRKLLFSWFFMLVGMSSLWVAFETSKVSVSLQIPSLVTNLKEKQSEEFFACSILKTLACCTAQKMKFSVKDFSSKCDQIRRKLHFLCSPRENLNIIKNRIIT